MEKKYEKPAITVVDISLDASDECVVNDDFARLKGHKYMSVSTTAFNNGLLEGMVNKIKAVKRSMFNRANTEALRAKVLYNGMNGKGFTRNHPN